MSAVQSGILGWFAASNLIAFLLFGWDKAQARRAGRRVPEATLLLWCAVGGWPGGWLGLVLVRHKSAKPAFLLLLAAAFAGDVIVTLGALRLAGWV